MYAQEEFSSRIAQGSRDKKRTKRVAISFGNELFDEVRSLAVKEQVSFAEQVRELIRLGLIIARI